jgi:predicted RNA binding protein YcfA (HicA-like mRNA interferase family)
MSRLPVLRPQAVIRALQRGGFQTARIRGSHYHLVDPRTGRRVTVPHHNRDLSRSLLNSILNQAGISADEFLGLL